MNKKSNTNSEIVEINLQGHAAGILKQAVEFLGIFLPKTLAKRLVAIILLAIGVPVKTAIGLTGLSERSLWMLHKQLPVQDVSEIMVFHYGGRRPAKASGLEGQILAEIKAGSYHTRQEIADMVLEKFHVKMSRTSVGRLLKKRHQMAEMRFPPGKGRYREAKQLF